MPLKLISRVCVVALLAAASLLATAQRTTSLWTGAKPIQETTAVIMERERNAPKWEPGMPLRVRIEQGEVDRSQLRSYPGAQQASQWPLPTVNPLRLDPGPRQPQTATTSFVGITLNESGQLPPDTQGSVGPTQVMMLANGRIKILSKAGVVGSLNSSLDAFFNTVRGGQDTFDPRCRFDPISQRWFVIAAAFGQPNRVVLAVSDSNTITATTVWSFYFFQHDLVGPTPNVDTGSFCDYPTLGIDANALYIGANLFNPNYIGSTLYVIRKSSITSGGPIVASAFRRIAGGAAEGCFTPQGSDNWDPAATTGYVIGVSDRFFSRLVMHRVGTPGGTPTLSAPIYLVTPLTTSNPIDVAVPGGRTLDTVDDRLFHAWIRRDHVSNRVTLWTTHNIGVNASGTTGGANRTGSRWYELENIDAPTPSFRQTGTIFDSTATNPRSYFIPGIAMSGQGHMATGFTVAGPILNAGVAFAGRWRTDALGTQRPVTVLVNSTFQYAAQGGINQRWGDYSFSAVDPTDNQTIWTFQQYTSATNVWATRAVRLLAPGSAVIANLSPNSAAPGQTLNVTVNGTSTDNREFFDSGPSIPNRIAAFFSGSGVTVNSVTFVNPTTITLNITLDANAATGLRNLTVTNPDGQSVLGTGVFTVANPTPAITSLSPNSREALSGAFTLTVDGSNFVSGAQIQFNGNSRTTTFVNSGRLTASIPATDLATVGSFPITVVNPGTGASNSLPFQVTPIVRTPATWQWVQGLDFAGGLAEVQTSNNVYVSGRLNFNTSRANPPLNGVATAITPLTGAPSRIDFSYELSATLGGLTAQLQAWDFVAGAWVTIDTSPVTTSDVSRTIALTTNLGRFIGPGGEVRSRVAFTLLGTGSRSVRGRIDQIGWTITP